MVLRLKPWESKSSPDLPKEEAIFQDNPLIQKNQKPRRDTNRPGLFVCPAAAPRCLDKSLLFVDGFFIPHYTLANIDDHMRSVMGYGAEHNHQAVYEQLSSGEHVAGLKDIPIDIMRQQVAEAVSSRSGWQQLETNARERTNGPGAFMALYNTAIPAR